MKCLSFSMNGRTSYGVLLDTGLVDLGHVLGDRYPSLLDVIEAGQWSLMEQTVQRTEPQHSLSQVVLQLPMPNVKRIFCVGRNYKGHVAEVGAQLPEHPSLFLRTAQSLAPTDQPIVRPRVSTSYDFEGELTLVIGKAGRHIPKEKALEHVFGYTIMNDGSVRDYQSKHSLAVGKNFERAGSMGPWIVTSDEIRDPSKLMLSTHLNGQQVQHSPTDDLIFDVPTIIAYISQFTTLQPGDVIATGTPDGVGFTRTPPLWLKPNDLLEVTISGIGTLTNQVIDEP
ncbi:MAG: FAA hydrolase family protein [Betaproteobacteria bacterium]|jgi:2-keto-4-pentenoate hydratase/2-oxohepta-3-ene-1,7-dioic acid hydratase in catechol pathway|nr:FAA hydrolase family protein [Betaproteobacteria bacterium]